MKLMLFVLYEANYVVGGLCSERRPGKTRTAAARKMWDIIFGCGRRQSRGVQ